MNGIEKKIRESNLKHSPVIDITDYDDNSKYLIGWPGYRTSQNKSGLGYVETQAEMAHMYGLFIKWLLTGKFRTRNPFYLLAITSIGVLCGGLPTIIILYEIIVLGNWSILRLTIDGLLVLTISDLLLINAILSIVNRNGKTITGD
jgi:hypothetical protein